MGHSNHNHHSIHAKHINRAFYIGIGLNSIFTAIEFIIGYNENSIALIADASHNLSDVASLIISLIGLKLSEKSATALYTYGYKKASILASLINSILLVFILANIFIEGIERLSSPQIVSGKIIIIVASIGVLINAISAYMFYKGQKHDINIKGAFLHLLIDALISAGVVISGFIIFYTNFYVIDSIISFAIGIVVLFSTWKLLMVSVKLTMDGVPENIDTDEIRNVFLKNEFIKDIHHLHIWAMSSTENALTVHIVLKNNIDTDDYLQAKNDLKEQLSQNNIQHSTLEIENADCLCKDLEC